MKVCFVIPTDLFVQEYMPCPYFRALKEINTVKDVGHNVCVISLLRYMRDFPTFEIRNGIEIHRLYLLPPKKNILRRLLFFLKLSKAVAEKIKSLRPNMIICHDIELLYASVLAKKALSIPLFYDTQEDFPALIKEQNKVEGTIFELLEKRMLKHVSHTFVVSEGIADRLRTWGYPVSVLYNSKELFPSKYERDYLTLKCAIGFEKNDFIVGFVGSLDILQPIEMLIALLKDLPDNIKLLIVGGREKDINTLRSICEANNAGNRVVLTGLVDYKVALNYVAVFDVGTIILPPLSNNYLFRCPIKLFDYMGIGIPMIISGFPDMTRIVIDDCNCGLAIDPTNPAEIREAILYLYRHKDEVLRMGRNARAKFEQKYCWEKERKKLNVWNIYNIQK
jgi:glycosyltransferase involved in cell wall biosynthesis